MYICKYAYMHMHVSEIWIFKNDCFSRKVKSLNMHIYTFNAPFPWGGGRY